MQIREQRTVFGEIADEYDRLRPGYPAAMVDGILGAAGPGPVLEVGAGTGKATELFVRRGADLTCIEPDARMAAVLRRKFPDVEVVASTLEDWQPDHGYGLLFSAQAWHWVDQEKRADLAWAALAPGGLFAPFWNVFLVVDPALHTALSQIDQKHGVAGNVSHSHLAAAAPALVAFEDDWPQLRLTSDRFTDFTSRRYESELAYSSADYRQYLLTTSTYRMLEPTAAQAVLDDTVAAVEAHGGKIEFQIYTDVALARRVQD